MSDETKKTILIVDDERLNINMLVEALEKEHATLAAKNGEQALKRARGETPPDLILLDIKMPGMDGLEVCRRLKASRKTREIPVIFITSLSETSDETAGLAVGAVDYITKPFQIDIVRARVATHLALKQAQDANKELLNETLGGSIRMLVEILSHSNPLAFERAMRLRRAMREMIADLKLPGAWQYEIAAMLSQIGCVTLPPDLLGRIFKGLGVSLEERSLFDEHPSVGKSFLARIPRLEKAAAMIGAQFAPGEAIPPEADLRKVDAGLLGGAILRLLSAFDQKLTLGSPPREILEELKDPGMGHFPPLVEALSAIIARRKVIERSLMVHELAEGMILAQDVVTESGALLAPKGAEISLQTHYMLRNAVAMGTLKGLIMVQDPQTPPLSGS